MKRIGWLGVLFLITFAPGLAAREVIIDLAAQDPGSTEQRPANPGEELTITIINRVPSKTYDVTIERKVILIAELPPLPSGAPAAENCTNLVGNFVLELQPKENEDAVGGLVREYRRKVSACPASVQQDLDAAIRENTVRAIPDIYTLDSGEELVVTITRTDDSTPTWITKFSTGSRGEWRTSYGFNFIPDEDETYFSQERGDGEFRITRNADREDFDFAPSFFYTWFSRKQQQKDLAIGPMAGLGFDSENPVVFGGIAFSYSQNIQLNLGAVIHQQKRLSGRFEPNQMIEENLGSEQLDSSTYNINWFLGLSFRLGANPFGGSDDGEEEQDPEQ